MQIPEIETCWQLTMEMGERACQLRFVRSIMPCPAMVTFSAYSAEIKDFQRVMPAQSVLKVGVSDSTVGCFATSSAPLCRYSTVFDSREIESTK